MANPLPIQLGVMTDFNACMLGEELELAPAQLYFFERDTMRQCRTAKVDVPGTMEGDGHKPEEEEQDLSVYIEPYQEGDIVALMPMNDGRYLVLGRLINGEEVEEPELQIEEDWA